MEGLLEVSHWIHQNIPFKLETFWVKWQTDAAWGFKQQQVRNFSKLPAKRYSLAIYEIQSIL